MSSLTCPGLQGLVVVESGLELIEAQIKILSHNLLELGLLFMEILLT